MNDQELEKLRRRFGGDLTPQTPPEDLLATLKKEIPDSETLRENSRRETSITDHPSMWRLAASVLMLFGFAYVSVRIYLDSRAERSAMYTPEYAPVARSASAERLPEPAANPETTTANVNSPADTGVTAPSAQPAPHAPAFRLAAPPPPPPPPVVAATDEMKKSAAPSHLEREATTPAPMEDARAASNSVESRDADGMAKPAAAPPAAMGAVAAAPAQAAEAAKVEQRAAAGSTQRLYTLNELTTWPERLAPIQVEALPSEADGLKELPHAEITVAEDGTVRDVVIVNEMPESLKKKATAALEHARFSPGLVDGKPVAVRMRTGVSLRVRHRR